jgi:hypothetical protein
MEDQEVASVNTGDPEAALYHAERRVLKIQTKLYQWACGDPGHPQAHLGLTESPLR